jgi:hypothetical protein
MLAHARQRGVRFNRECTITVDDLKAAWESQDGLCAYTGLPLTRIRGQGDQPTNASLDRIDPSRGYTPDNIALVQRRVNEMKWDNTLESLIEISEAIASRRILLEERYIRNDDASHDADEASSF